MDPGLAAQGTDRIDLRRRAISWDQQRKDHRNVSIDGTLQIVAHFLA